METKEQFYTAIAAISLQIEEHTNELMAMTHMIQAANETGMCSLGVSRGIEGWDGTNNLTGISPDGKIANYATLDDYANAYIRVIETEGYGYPAVLAATNVRQQLIALGESDWNVAHYSYGGVVGGRLLAILATDHTIIADILRLERERQQNNRLAAESRVVAMDPEEPVKGELLVTKTPFASMTTLERGVWYVEQVADILRRLEDQTANPVQGAQRQSEPLTDAQPGA